MRARAVVTCIVLLGAVTSALPRSAHAQEPPTNVDADAKEKSRAAFRKGVAQLRAQDWGAARASFESAWTLFPHASSLLNLGIARLRTDDPVHAEQDLVRFLSEDVGASPDELAGAREALAEARTKIGALKVIVVSPPSARVLIDGKAVDTVRRPDAGASGVVAEVRAKPGKHSVTVEAEGHSGVHRDIDVVAKSEVAMTVKLVPVDADAGRPSKPVEDGPPMRAVVGWSLAGIAGAALITGAFTALRAKTLSDEYSDKASSRYQDDGVRADGVTFRTAADVALGIALVSGAAAVILLLTDVGKSSSADVSRGAVLRW